MGKKNKKSNRIQFLKDDKHGLFIDPNYGNENLPIENLSIEVDLAVFERNRSFIKIDENEPKPKKIATTTKTTPPFGKGTQFGDKNFKLTTAYTEVSDLDYDGAETLGITNVEIDFNSSLMPMITMEMVDVKGKLFQKGMKSPYASFFKFPYPLFELRVKGYFGKPVTFLLHLTNFKAKMDSQTGNFVINCSFNGYTYAYLSDILLGYLKAIPHTEAGYGFIRKEENKGEDFITFEELYQYAGKLNDKIAKLRDSEDIKALSKGYNYANMINDIKNRVRTAMNIVDTKNYNTRNTDGKIVFIKPTSDSLNILKTRLKDIQKDVRVINDSIDASNYKIDLTLFDLVKSKNHFTNQPISNFLDDDKNVKEKYYGSIDLLKDEDEFRYVAKKIKHGGSLFNTKGYTDIVYLKSLLDDIEGKLKSINDELEEKKRAVSDLEFDDLTNVKLTDEDGASTSFNFNLYDYTKVLCDHVDVFMSSVEKVATEAEDNPERNAALREGAENLGDVPNASELDVVYAFPSYRKKKKDVDGEEVFMDAWIGEDHPDIAEARFVKDLYRGIIQSKQLDETYSMVLEEPNMQWYSINAFDIKVHTENNNPWESIGNGGEKEIIRMMVLRAVIFMGMSVRNPTDNEIKAMAELEAHNLFSFLKNPKIKNAMRTIGDLNDENKISTYIQNDVNLKGNEVYRNSFSAVNQDKIITNELVSVSGEYKWIYDEGNKTYERYKYIGAHPTKKSSEIVDSDGKIADETRFFLPLYFDNNEDNFDGNSIMEASDRVSLRDKGDIFFSDYLGPNAKDNDKPDDGATYLKIMEVEPFSKIVTKPSYGEAILEMNDIDNTKVWSPDDIDSKDVMFNGLHNTLDYSIIDYKDPAFDNAYSFSTYFYDNPKVGEEGVSDLKFSVNFSIDISIGAKSNSKDMSEKYSLLGSPWYYIQNDYGKAFLILNSLPFRSTDIVFKKKNIRKLFEYKSANIEVPYTWVLWVGALLYRAKNECIIFSRLPGSDLVAPKKDQMFKPQNGLGSQTQNTFIRDNVLVSLPQSVKEQFINEFEKWVNSNSFTSIKDQLDIFEQSGDEFSPNNDIIPRWIEAHNNDFSKLKNTGNYTTIKPSVTNKKITTENASEIESKYGFLTYFELELNKDGDAHYLLTQLLNEKRVIVNATWRIWANDLANDAKVPGSSHPITFEEGRLNKYVNAFIMKLHSLLEQHYQSEERIQGEVFGSGSINEIYLTIYKNIKSIYDKWISGDSKRRESYKNLIDTFKFIDRGYNDIGEKFKLNPIHIKNLLTSSYNNSFYSHMSRVLDNNNFNFMPLPNFVDLTSKSEMSNLFRVFEYNSGEATSSPSFVCMYVGENSNSLEGSSDFTNDGIDVLAPTVYNTPDDFKSVPGILINYGDENQSIFKSLELDQAEYGETNESLMVTDQIATSYNNINSVGQNIFDIYNNRAYNAGVELLGNAALQPFMYFQLNNIPMFRGAYVVTKVSHSITPNHMTTKLTGNRVRRTKTPLIDKESIFYSMIGSFADIASSSANLSDLNNIKNSSRVDDEHSGLTANDFENDLDIQLTENFKLSEFKSGKDDSSIPKFAVERLKTVAAQLEIIRKTFKEKYPDNNVTLNVTSGYRSPSYNKSKYTNGVEGSNHTKGYAADFEIRKDGTEIDPSLVFNTVYDLIEDGKIIDGGLGGYSCKKFGTFVHYDIKDKGDRWRCYDSAAWAKKLKGTFKK